MENQRNSNCLKICSRQVWKSTIGWRKKTKWTASNISCVVMHYKASKTSPAPTERFWAKSWLCSVENTWNLNQWLRQSTKFNDWFQSRKPEVNRLSRRTPKISERCIRNCCSSNHRVIHLCQNASPPDEIKKPGAFGERHIWTDCVAFWKGVGTEWFASPRRNVNKHCDTTSLTTKLWWAQTNVPPLQKTRSLSKSLPSTQTRKRPKPKQHG